MLNISGLKEGFVLDHIQAGRSMDIYFKLGLDKLDCQVAIIKNARSSKMGRKDIIKIDGSLDLVNVMCSATSNTVSRSTSSRMEKS